MSCAKEGEMRFKSYAAIAVVCGLIAVGYWLGSAPSPVLPDTAIRGELAAAPGLDASQVVSTPRERIGSNGP